ncbi:MAG: DNA repair protein RadA [Acidobacteriota bacterium]|nr:DNA repair protein RadA [Blastocatellia bacterium]MDW8412515.1 DNA repair protein RadA [Acidobacteriota bacterium]
MTKQKTVYICQNCGFQSPKWIGRCSDCGEWNSMVEEKAPKRSAISPQTPSQSALLYAHVDSQQTEKRLSTGIAELDRVLGGGIVPGSLVLIGGDPGIGKSTLLLQAAEKISLFGNKVIYVSGEESERQVKLRGERIGINPAQLYLLPETCLERILDEADKLKPTTIILDSIQTIFSEKLESAPGSITQIREVASQLLAYSKQRCTTVFLIGHVTKDGAIAGPKALEHIVDTVLYFEGQHSYNHRLIRAVKNRFGPANELGIFEMTTTGLIPVKSASELFLSQRPLGVSGSAIVACLEGTRPILIELQALVASGRYGTGKRMSQGVDPNRVALLIAMLERRLGMQILGDDVFVNVAGGINITEPAVDLGIVTAILSSYRNLPIDPMTVVFGEVGLAGEVRATTQPLLRLREASAMGMKHCILPAGNLDGIESFDNIEIQAVRSVIDLIDLLF